MLLRVQQLLWALCFVIAFILTTAVQQDAAFEPETEAFVQNLRRKMLKAPPTEVPPFVFIIGVQKGGSSSLMWMTSGSPS